MADFMVQPTKKWIRFEYTLVSMIFCVAVGIYVNELPDQPAWLLIFPALLFLWPLSRQLSRMFTRIVVSGDKLRYESGILSRTTRSIQVSKIQDVRIDQTLVQRLIAVGNLSIETAGETSRLTIMDVDSPQAVADELLEATQSAPRKRKGEPV